MVMVVVMTVVVVVTVVVAIVVVVMVVVVIVLSRKTMIEIHEALNTDHAHNEMLKYVGSLIKGNVFVCFDFVTERWQSNLFQISK